MADAPHEVGDVPKIDRKYAKNAVEVFVRGDVAGKVCNYIAENIFDIKCKPLIGAEDFTLIDRQYLRSVEGYHDITIDARAFICVNIACAPEFTLITNSMREAKTHGAAIYSSTVSVASLLFDHLNAIGMATDGPAHQPPHWMPYLNDIITREYALPASRPLEAYLTIEYREFIKILTELSPATIAQKTEIGTHYIEANRHIVKAIAASAWQRFIAIQKFYRPDAGGDLIPVKSHGIVSVVISPVLIEEVATELLSGHKTVIAAVVRRIREEWRVTLRSDSRVNFNIGDYCRKHRGEGDKTSGGFRFSGPIEHLFKDIEFVLE